MADTVSQWQTVGTTFKQEIPSTSHLGPDSTNRNTAGSNYAQSTSARNARGNPTVNGPRPNYSQFAHPASTAVHPNTSHLVRTLSRTGSLRLKHGRKLTPCDRMARFFNRLSWNQRSKGYMFSKNFSQRQPSFVVTPDRSSCNYSYTGPDLSKRRPKPHVWRTSRPVNMWKNPNPMDVLQNNGQVQLPSFVLNATQAPRRQREEPNADAATAKSTTTTRGRKSSASEHYAAKISLPVKQHTSSTSNPEFPSNPDETQDTTKMPNTSSSSSGPNRSGSSWLDALPQTPVHEQAKFFDDDEEDAPKERGSPQPTGLRYMKTPQKKSVHALPIVPDSHASDDDISDLAAPNRPVTPRTAEYVSGDRTSELATPRSQAVAQTLAEGATSKSPTASPSSYRPESWRRSAIIARESLVVDPYDVEDDVISTSASETATSAGGSSANFADLWSSYLRRAIAQRAMSTRRRKSTEMRNEWRWSRNMQWDSDPETRSESSASNASFDFQSSSEELGLGHSSSESLPLPSPPALATPQRRVFSADYPYRRSTIDLTPSSDEDHGSFVTRSPPRASDVTISRLAPRNSPRAMAAASRTQLQTTGQRNQDHSRDSSMKLTPSCNTSPLLSNQSELDSESTQRFSDRVEDAPMRYIALFADSRGQSSNTPWQQESGSSQSLNPSSGVSSGSKGSDQQIEQNKDDQDVEESFEEPSNHETEQQPLLQQTEEPSSQEAEREPLIQKTEEPLSQDTEPLSQKTEESLSQKAEESLSQKTEEPLSQETEPLTQKTEPVNEEVEQPLKQEPEQRQHSRKASSNLSIERSHNDSTESATKRPFPSPSPVGSPVSSPIVGPSEHEVKSHNVPEDTERARLPLELSTPIISVANATPSASVEHLALTPEPAAAIVRNQSRWNRSQKRVKSSGSKEHLLHSRQKTMESMWGEESDDSNESS